jgi:flagellar assembly factor FliW
MKIKTKIFGEIEISEEKIVTFQDGIIGFPEMKRFALLHDEERGSGAGASASSSPWTSRASPCLSWIPWQ